MLPHYTSVWFLNSLDFSVVCCNFVSLSIACLVSLSRLVCNVLQKSLVHDACIECVHVVSNNIGFDTTPCHMYIVTENHFTCSETEVKFDPVALIPAV